MKRGDLYLIWNPADITKRAWFYLHHNNGLPVFVDRWPPIVSEGFLTQCQHALKYKFICSLDHDYYFVEDDNGKD